MKNSDMPASPTFDRYGYIGSTTCVEGFPHKITGLTKREAFAMVAMQGCCANSAGYNNDEWVNRIAKDSVLLADALLAELSK